MKVKSHFPIVLNNSIHIDAIIARWNWIPTASWCLLRVHKRNNIGSHHDCAIPHGNVQLTWRHLLNDVIHGEVLQCVILIWKLSGSAATS